VRFPGLHTLDRYFLREIASPFLFGVALFTFFLFLDRIYELTDLVVTKGVPFHLVLQLLLYMLPSFLTNTLPMALLVAVLLAGGRLSADLEIVACKAAGLSLWRLFRPLLLAAIVITLLSGALTLVLAPRMNQAFQAQLFRILQARASSGLKERVFNTTFGDVVIYVEEVSASRVALKGLVVSDERDPKLSRIITAGEGRLFSDEATQRITLRLLDGGVNEGDVHPANAPEDLTREVLAPGGAAGAKRYRYTAFQVYDMNLTVESPIKTTARFEKPEKDLGLGALSRKIAELRDEPRTRAPYLVERHKRFALPLAAVVFALVGFPLAAASQRGGRSIALVGSLGILVSYYLMLTTLEGVANRGAIPAGLAIWAPNALFACVGGALFLVTAREWRAPRMSVMWRALDVLWQSVPRPRVRREQRFATAARETTLLIDRYLVRQFLVFMGFTLAVAAALFVVIDLVQTLDRYLRIKPPLVYIAEHFVYRLPAALHDALPIVMLVATIFLFLTLTRYHELTALKAAGMSLYRASAPILLLAVVVAIGSGLFQELALPVLNERGDEVDRVKIRGQQPRHLQSRSRLWLRSGDTRFYRVELLSPMTGELYGMTVLEIDDRYRLVNRLDARKAHWTPQGWDLSEGAFREIAPGGRVTTVPFQHAAIELEESFADFTQIQKPVSAMSYLELRDYVDRLQAAGFQVKKYLVDLHSKLSSPLKNLIMVLVAIPFALQSPRGGRLFGVGLAIAIMAAYTVIHYVALALSRADLLPPLLAAWTANITFLGIGASLFLRART
jgi:lipopolysaccharide export system permease protein